jgi:ribosomal protein L37E
MLPFIKLWTDKDAICGNIYRVEFLDGSVCGYPSEKIRDYAIERVTGVKPW